MSEYHKELDRVIGTIEAFRELNPLISSQQIQAMLLVARHPGIQAKHITAQAGIAESSATRNLQALGATHRSGEPGFGLIEMVDDVNDRRNKKVFMTPKGRGFMRRILTIYTGNAAEDFDAPTASEARTSGRY